MIKCNVKHILLMYYMCHKYVEASTQTWSLQMGTCGHLFLSHWIINFSYLYLYESLFHDWPSYFSFLYP